VEELDPKRQAVIPVKEIMVLPFLLLRESRSIKKSNKIPQILFFLFHFGICLDLFYFS